MVVVVNGLIVICFVEFLVLAGAIVVDTTIVALLDSGRVTFDDKTVTGGA